MPSAFFAVSETALTTSRTGWKSFSAFCSGRLALDPLAPVAVAPSPGLAKMPSRISGVRSFGVVDLETIVFVVFVSDRVVADCGP